jgi:hypothetical protein
MALSDRQHDIDATSAQSMDQRGTPWGKRTTTKQEDFFFHRSLRTPKSATGGTSNANTVRTSTAQTSKVQRKHKNPKHIRNISAIVDTGAQVPTMPESAVSKMPNAHNRVYAQKKYGLNIRSRWERIFFLAKRVCAKPHHTVSIYRLIKYECFV